MAAAVDISDLPAPPDISDLPAPPSRVGWAEENLAGPSEIIGSTVANIPHAAAHAAVDLYRRVTGGNTDAPDPAAVQALQVPLGQGGQQLLGDIGSLASPVTSTLKGGLNAADDVLGRISPTAQDVVHQAGGVASDVANLAPVAGLVKGGVSAAADAIATKAPTITETAQAAINRTAASGNAGAAGATLDASKLSPETQAELATVKDVNPTALKNIHDAETLPVPMAGERGLTAGQATQDSGQISDEFNRKGENGNAIGKRYDAQDQGLQENLSEIHRDAAPTTVGNDDIQNGKAMMDSLKRYDAPKVDAINAEYKEANDMNVAAGKGGLTLDPKAAVDHAATALEDRMELLPAEGKSILDKLQAAVDDGKSIPLKQAETWRTTIAGASRQADAASNGNAVRALSDLRDAVEKMTPNNAATSAVADKFSSARGLAKARFDEMDADPAYKAAVEDDTPIGRLSTQADKFTQKYVLNGNKADLQQLRPKLDQEGGEAMTSSAMNYLQRQAGLDRGKFIQDGYNRALTKIGPKATELIGDSDTLDQLQKLGRVSKNMQVSSRGGYSNTSHSFVAAAKAMATHAGEDLFNGVLPGARIGTKAAEFLARRQGAASIHEALKPGAGLEN
jgi:hypothetical protein